MNRYELRRLQKKVNILNEKDKPVYLKLNDCIYRCKNESAQLVEVNEIPGNAIVEIVDCKRDEFFYWFCFNSKPYYEIMK